MITRKILSFFVLIVLTVSITAWACAPDIPDINSKNVSETERTKEMQLMIENLDVPVRWEDNESVDALRELVKDEPLTISLSMYGGFEQVGSLGTSLPRKDQQTTTSAGDIVLYSGNQIVVFYGSNSWAYTRLGHVELSAAEMSDLLSHGDVTITFFAGQTSTYISGGPVRITR